VTVAAASTLAATNSFKGAGTAGAGVVDNGYRTSLATVARQDLSSQTNVDAALGHAGSYSIVNQAHGTLTGLRGSATPSARARSATR
jgi:hypothetical protein